MRHPIFIAVFLLLLAAAVGGGSKAKKRRKEERKWEYAWKKAKGDCTGRLKNSQLNIDFCKDDPLISVHNCVLRCISESCYDGVYGTEALEDGEVDVQRAEQFRKCVIEELKRRPRAQPTSKTEL